jgi:hypothetical protein
MMENPRTTSARDHDDRDLIEGAESAPGASGASGGNLQRDVASKAEADLISDPEAHERVTKQASIDHDDARPAQRARAPE